MPRKNAPWNKGKAYHKSKLPKVPHEQYLHLKPGYYFATLPGIERRLLVEVGFNGSTSHHRPSVFIAGLPDAFPIERFIDWTGPIIEDDAPPVKPKRRKRQDMTEPSDIDGSPFMTILKPSRHIDRSVHRKSRDCG